MGGEMCEGRGGGGGSGSVCVGGGGCGGQLTETPAAWRLTQLLLVVLGYALISFSISSFLVLAAHKPTLLYLRGQYPVLQPFSTGLSQQPTA